MDDIVSGLLGLLPGFVATAIIYSLTTAIRKSQFERIVEALVYTLLAQAGASLVRVSLLLAGKHLFVLGTWTDDSSRLAAIGCAVVIGLCMSIGINSDVPHRYFRRLHESKPESDGTVRSRRWRLTERNTYPSNWYAAFAKYKQHVILTMTDGRRLFGWPFNWPDNPSEGHFVITEASWMTESGSIPLTDVTSMLVPASEVKFVQFVQLSEQPSQ